MPILIAFCSLAVSMGAQTRAQELEVRDSVAPRLVVFVCEHGSVKSLVAMEYFNRGAKARALAYRAVARGTAPEPKVLTNYTRGKEAIVRHVDALLDELARGAPP